MELRPLSGCRGHVCVMILRKFIVPEPHGAVKVLHSDRSSYLMGRFYGIHEILPDDLILDNRNDWGWRVRCSFKYRLNRFNAL